MSVEREVRIFGQIYRVRGQDPDRIYRSAQHVDQVMNGLLGGQQNGLSSKGAVLAALNIAEELEEYRGDAEKALLDVTARIDELLHLLPE